MSSTVTVQTCSSDRVCFDVSPPYFTIFVMIDSAYVYDEWPAIEYDFIAINGISVDRGVLLLSAREQYQKPYSNYSGQDLLINLHHIHIICT